MRWVRAGAPPKELTTFAFHAMAERRVVGSGLPRHVPLRQHPDYRTETEKVGKYTRVLTSVPAKHCRIATDVTKGGTARFEESRSCQPPLSEDTVQKLDAYRQVSVASLFITDCGMA